MRRRSSRITCPVCGLELVVRGPRTVSYDVVDWAERCFTLASGSPALCPALLPQTLAATASVTPQTLGRKVAATLH
jgi:hypothetical protein